VLKLEAEQLHATPGVVSERSRGFVRGVARVGPRLLMLLNLVKVIGEEQLHDDPDHILEDGKAGRRALPS
jgi:purine-binding chemotaxis protein CheW